MTGVQTCALPICLRAGLRAVQASESLLFYVMISADFGTFSGSRGASRAQDVPSHGTLPFVPASHHASLVHMVAGSVLLDRMQDVRPPCTPCLCLTSTDVRKGTTCSRARTTWSRATCSARARHSRRSRCLNLTVFVALWSTMMVGRFACTSPRGLMLVPQANTTTRE